MDERNRPNFGANPFGTAVKIPYASSTSTELSGASEKIRLAANLSSTLAESPSSDSAMENPRFAGAMSPLGTKPWIAYLFGSCDRLAYAPCSTAEIAGLNALMPVAPPAGLAAVTGAGSDAGGLAMPTAAGCAGADAVADAPAVRASAS
jgi:hypothetical protein